MRRETTVVNEYDIVKCIQFTVWDKKQDKHVRLTAQVAIDTAALAQLLGPRATTSKVRKAKLAGGAVLVEWKPLGLIDLAAHLKAVRSTGDHGGR